MPPIRSLWNKSGLQQQKQNKTKQNKTNNNRKPGYTWRLNKCSTQQYLGQRRNKERNQRLFRINENEGTTYPNSWDTMKAVLRGKLISPSASKKKLEKVYTGGLTELLKAMEQKEAN